MNTLAEPRLSAGIGPGQEFRSKGRWTRSRWWAVVGLIFVIHIGLIVVLGDRKPIAPRQPAFTPQLRLAADADEFFALNDPTLFALPHANGFSGAGWMRIPRVQPEPFQWTESPRWLQLPVEQLGTAFTRFMQTNEFTRYSPELKSTPRLAWPNTSPVVPTSNVKSVLRIEGDLASRKLLNATALLSWSATDLLAASVVQVLVDEAGGVISAVMLPPGSGLKEADQSALRLARSARFAPLPHKSGETIKTASHWMRGRMIFQWTAVPLSQTNAPSLGP